MALDPLGAVNLQSIMALSCRLVLAALKLWGPGVLQVGEGPYPSLWEPQAALDVEETVRRSFLCRT